MTSTASSDSPSVRILHTGDWQLGMTRHFLDADAQARFTAARIDAIRRIGDVARREGCAAIVVAGDVFETNLVERRVVVRALQAMSDTALPVLLLPGNHDPLDPTSIYRSPTFITNRPHNVVVLDGVAPHPLAPGVEIVGAPWRSKRPTVDPCSEALASLTPDGTVRVLVGHGAADTLAPDVHDPAHIEVAALVDALDEGRVHYVALGDRHSWTEVTADGRVAYAGAPEPTAFDEVDPGKALVVDVSAEGVTSTPVAVGTWRYLTIEAALDDSADLVDLCARLDVLDAKDTSIVRLGLRGTISLALAAQLDAAVADRRDGFAALEEWVAGTDLVRLPDVDDLQGLDLGGASRAAASELGALVTTGDDDRGEALDALALLHRLARRAA
jgi:DNA repair exonuclease SbcCD nuclease subunit